MNSHPPAQDTAEPGHNGRPDIQDDDALGDFLAEQDAPWLAEQLVRVAQEDPVVQARLTAAAGLDDAVPLTEQALRHAVLALRPGALDWDIDGDDGSERLRRCIDLLDDLAEYGYVAESTRLARRAADLLNEAHPELDDGTPEALEQRAGTEDSD